MNHELMLHEELMLLSLKDREGTVEPGAMYHYAIGGAIIAELLMRERLKVDRIKKQDYLVVNSLRTTGDELVDSCMQTISEAKKTQILRHWVGKFGGLSDLKHRVAEQLCTKGILSMEKDKVLLLFTRRIYPEVNPEPERTIIKRLEQAIFYSSSEVDPRTVVLISLAHHTGILKATFDKKELKNQKDRIELIISGDLTGNAAKEVIAAMQAAVIVTTVIVPTVVC